MSFHGRHFGGTMAAISWLSSDRAPPEPGLINQELIIKRWLVTGNESHVGGLTPDFADAARIDLRLEASRP